jgi:preprotein translocase subunit YajC
MSIISTAYAQATPSATPAAGAGMDQSPWSSMIFLVLIFVVFYFFLIRPQQKRFKEHQNMVNNIRRGDKVVTGGGIFGTVSKVMDDNESVEVEIAPEVKVRVAKHTISAVMNKPGVSTPSNENNSDAAAKSSKTGAAKTSAGKSARSKSNKPDQQA